MAFRSPVDLLQFTHILLRKYNMMVGEIPKLCFSKKKIINIHLLSPSNGTIIQSRKIWEHTKNERSYVNYI